MIKSKIEWTDGVWNPVTGCTKVSEGCRNCYAERMHKRFYEEPFSKVTLHNDRLEQPLRWRKPQKVFVCSMGDLFHEQTDELFIIKVFTIMESCYWHKFIILTKRANRMKRLLSHPRFPDLVRKFGYDWLGASKYNERGPFWRNNMWLGVSIEDQKTADERIPILLQTPAAVRFVSIEPMLNALNLTSAHKGTKDFLSGRDFELLGHDNSNKLDWVIVGGESGPGARPMHPDWLRSIRDQCQEAGVPFFFKQYGEFITKPAEECFHNSSNGAEGPVSKLGRMPYIWKCNCCGKLHDGNELDFIRVGKKRAGRLLDGREWNEFPN